jgi:hypothetical protein
VCGTGVVDPGQARHWFLVLGVLGVWLFLGFSHYIVLMLSPFLAPLVAPWAARTQQKLADRVIVDLRYGAFLAEVFTGREFQRAQAWQNAPRPGLRALSRSIRVRSRIGTRAEDIEPGPHAIGISTIRGRSVQAPPCQRIQASVRVVDVLPASSTGSATLSKMIGTLVFALSSAIVASTGAVDHNVTLTPE